MHRANAVYFPKSHQGLRTEAQQSGGTVWADAYAGNESMRMVVRVGGRNPTRN